MNKKTLFSFLAIALFTTFSFAQNRALPNKDVKTLDGSNFNITNLENASQADIDYNIDLANKKNKDI